MATISPDDTLGEIVTNHPDLARHLEERGLDYCCGGGQSLAEACAASGLDPAATASALGSVTTAPPEPWADLGPAALVDHIESTHHAYLHSELPRLGELAAKVATVHGDRHPELASVLSTYVALRNDLEPHLAKEERVLFPGIRQLAAAEVAPSFPFGTVQNPISMMMREHDHAGELLASLRELTGGYEAPEDGCASYRALYDGLAELEADTHLHVHKENNRLFPAVVALEEERAGA